MSGREDSLDERQRRVGLNEALFRTVNERIDDLTETFAVVSDDFEIVCECGDAACVERVAVPSADYRRIRSDSTLFLLVPGHQIATTEAVVEDDRERGYVVV